MGMPLERAFVSFEPQPLASASVAQVRQWGRGCPTGTMRVYLSSHSYLIMHRYFTTANKYCLILVGNDAALNQIPSLHFHSIPRSTAPRCCWRGRPCRCRWPSRWHTRTAHTASHWISRCSGRSQGSLRGASSGGGGVLVLETSCSLFEAPLALPVLVNCVLNCRTAPSSLQLASPARSGPAGDPLPVQPHHDGTMRPEGRGELVGMRVEARAGLRVEVRAAACRRISRLFRESVRLTASSPVDHCDYPTPAVQAVHLERFHQNFATVASQVRDSSRDAVVF